MKERSAVSRAALVVVVVAVIVIIGVAAYVAVTLPGTSTSSTSTSSTGTSPPSSSSTTSSASTSSATSTGSSTSAAAPQTLVIDDANWPIDDMNVLYEAAELPWPQWYSFAVYQPLIDVNLTAEYQQGVIQYLPGLATSWTATQNDTVFTLNLRNVSFSNGDAFNAYQVWAEMYGFYYLSGNSSTWYESYDLFNMGPSNFGPQTVAMLTQSGLINPSSQALSVMSNSSWPIYVTGPHQIVFHLQAPFAYFPGTLVAFTGMVFDTQFVLDHGGFGTSASFNSYFNQNSIPGTGPYVVSGFSENSYIQFTQNQNYWGKGLSQAEISANPVLDPGHAKNVIIYYKSDDLARYTDLSTGAAQISAIESADWNLVQSNPNYAYSTLPPWNAQIIAIALNMNDYPTNITAVRQAIVHAINYSDIYSKVFFNAMSPTMGPEYSAWKQFYDLGNYPPYQYNLTLAQQILKNANINTQNLPSLSFRTVAGCSFCVNMAQIVQADLANIGITVNVDVLAGSDYWSVYGGYSTNVQNAQGIGQLSILGGEIWAPAALTPADYWVDFVNNASIWGNWAGYANPVVQKCVNAFTQTSDITQIQQLCTAAQKQIYNDAPYAWVGAPSLWYESGSLVWKKGVVNHFFLDPCWNGMSTTPIFNTVTFG